MVTSNLSNYIVAYFLLVTERKDDKRAIIFHGNRKKPNVPYRYAASVSAIQNDIENFAFLLARDQ